MASHLRDADDAVDQVGGDFFQTLMATAVKRNKNKKNPNQIQQEQRPQLKKNTSRWAACGWRVRPLPRGPMTLGHASSESDLHLIHSLAL